MIYNEIKETSFITKGQFYKVKFHDCVIFSSDKKKIIVDIDVVLVHKIIIYL